ncbi:MAG: hypothetical protein LBP19_00490 [Treponema sp.]|nr:hypothetical protein [Treponema sp.]
MREKTNKVMGVSGYGEVYRCRCLHYRGRRYLAEYEASGKGAGKYSCQLEGFPLFGYTRIDSQYKEMYDICNRLSRH